MLDVEEIKKAYKEKYVGVPLCLDLVDAKRCATLEQAIDLLYIDTCYWEDSFGNQE